MSSDLNEGDIDCLAAAAAAPLRWDNSVNPAMWTSGETYFARHRITLLARKGYLKPRKLAAVENERQGFEIVATQKAIFALARHRDGARLPPSRKPYPAWLPAGLRKEFDDMRAIAGVTRAMAEDHCRMMMRRQRQQQGEFA